MSQWKKTHPYVFFVHPVISLVRLLLFSSASLPHPITTHILNAQTFLHSQRASCSLNALKLGRRATCSLSALKLGRRELYHQVLRPTGNFLWRQKQQLLLIQA